jgi:hypothetical protein
MALDYPPFSMAVHNHPTLSTELALSEQDLKCLTMLAPFSVGLGVINNMADSLLVAREPIAPWKLPTDTWREWHVGPLHIYLKRKAKR